MNARFVAAALALGIAGFTMPAADATSFRPADIGSYTPLRGIEAVRDNGQLSRKQVYRALVRQGYEQIHITDGGRLWTVRAEDHYGHDVVLRVDPWSGDVVSERRLRPVHRRGEERRDYDDGGRGRYDDRGDGYGGGYDDPDYGSDY